jgi:carbon monoxide dehydrogenase subunit G
LTLDLQTIPTKRSADVVELDHRFTTSKSTDATWTAILDLERLISCVQGGSVVEQVDNETVKAQIDVRMGAMSMRFTGTVAIVERDDAEHRAVMRVKARETGGQGHANADVTFTLGDGGGTVHTAAQITGKAASMGEGVVTSVLDALINDFTGKLATI